jgi:hypothetical protein
LNDDSLKLSLRGRFRLNEPAVVADIIDGETIIMNLAAGDYYTLNASGGEIWLLLLAGLGRDDLAAAIAERHGIEPSAAEIDAFIGRLVEHQLIVSGDPTGGAEGIVEHPLPTPSAWATPEISVYADMKELLALDPPLPPLGPPLRPNRG